MLFIRVNVNYFFSIFSEHVESSIWIKFSKFIMQRTYERRKFSLLQRNDTCSQTSGNYMNALESKWIQKIIKVHLGFMESACNYRFLNEQMVHEVHLTENKSKRWKMNSVLFLIAMINNVPPKCIQWSSHIWVPFRIKR